MFTDQLQRGGLIGSWCSFASFASTELMTRLGFDFLILDMQHCEITQSDFPALFGAFRADGPTAVVRAPKNDYHVINWLFDQGAPAVLVPMVNSAEEAYRAVEAAKFPPLGRRSFGPFRAAAYGMEAASYMAEADRRSTLIVQVEDADAAKDIESILAVPGIDAIFMGPNDLAFSLLRKGQPSPFSAGSSDGAAQWTTFARTPEVIAICEQAMEKSRAAGIPWGITAGSVQDARAWLARGASFVTFGNDFLFLREGALHLIGKAS